MMPAAEHKGSALALLVDVMSGGVAGSNFSFEASSFVDTIGGPPDVGQVVLAIDPTATMGDGFVDRIEVELQALSAEPALACPVIAGCAHRHDADASGVEVPDDLMATSSTRTRRTRPPAHAVRELGTSWRRRPGYLDTATYGLPPRQTVELSHRVIDEWDDGTAVLALVERRRRRGAPRVRLAHRGAPSTPSPSDRPRPRFVGSGGGEPPRLRRGRHPRR